MKKKRQKPWETKLIEKIIDVTGYCFPGAEEEALKQFNKVKAKEISVMRTKVDFDRGFQTWFLLKYLIEEKFTPMEVISGNPSNYFTKRELQMVDNFLNNKEGFYEIISISRDKKDFTIKNVMNSEIISVKTIDFPNKLSKGEHIYTIPVQKLDGNYFFYGNVTCYSKENCVDIVNLTKIEKAHRLSLYER
ncbi:MAG: hypothetical protein ABIH25_00320 [Candidatus Woesearchaeota archaeon]